MELDILKESIIEYCENIFALGTCYIRKNDDIEIVDLLNKIELIEDEIRVCEEKGTLDKLKSVVENIGKILEDKFNE